MWRSLWGRSGSMDADVVTIVDLVWISALCVALSLLRSSDPARAASTNGKNECYIMRMGGGRFYWRVSVGEKELHGA